ncbi:MAG TPA: hypothetical protein DEA32_01840 [Firmicutes bacterium]|nr:hypothetical protein [Bacillota bacterium]
MQLKKVLGLTLASVSTLSLASCDTEALQNKLSSVADGLLPNLYVTIAQILIFAAVAAAVILLAYKPLKKKISQRKEFIESSVKKAQEDSQAAKDTLNKADKIKSDAQVEAGQIIEKARSIAEANAAQAQRDLTHSIEQQRAQAHRDIEDERRKMLRDAHTEIVQTAIDTSKQILGREVKEEDNAKMVDDFIDSIASDGKESSK